MKEVKMKPKYKVGNIIQHHYLGSDKFARIDAIQCHAEAKDNVSEPTIKIEYVLQNRKTINENQITRVVADK